MSITEQLFQCFKPSDPNEQIRRLAELAASATRADDEADKLDASLTRCEIDQKNRNYVAVAGNMGVTFVEFNGENDNENTN